MRDFTIFEMSRFEHLSHKEIADQLQLSEQTVRTQVKKALRILRSKLGFIGFIVFLIKF
ncbi:MAG: sigma factor-like helix-turn-helix DNA-binding protein [Bacteroidota bacterium]